MNPEQKSVMEFHKAFDSLIGDRPSVPDRQTQALRMKLIREETDELYEAFLKQDVVEVADALADLLYVVYGAAISCGIDIEPVFQEVHRSNMAKVGGHKREDGKWIKPEGWKPPDIVGVMLNQPPLDKCTSWVGRHKANRDLYEKDGKFYTTCPFCWKELEVDGGPTHDERKFEVEGYCTCGGHVVVDQLGIQSYSRG